MAKAEDWAGKSLWDDELEQLARHAAVLLGEAHVIDAADRAIRALAAGRTEPLSFADLRSALKAELKRIVRPH